MRPIRNRQKSILCLMLCTKVAQANPVSPNLEDLIEMSPAELADISVSIATGTSKSISKSAAVTTVITAEQIASMGATDLHEVLETVPGLHVTIQPITNDYSYSLRGMRNDTNAQILLMLNGTRFSVPYQGTHLAGMIVPVENIQRVEVIRGPGSAMYGADAFAGVINIVTKKSSDINGATIGARGGNDDMKSSWGQYGGEWKGWDVASSLQYSHNGIDHDRIIKADAQSQIDQTLTDLGIPSKASLAPGPMQNQNERWNAHLDLQRKHWNLGFWAYNETDAGFRAGTAGAIDNRGSVNGNHFLGDVRFSSEDSLNNWELQAHASFLYTDVNANIYNFPAGSLLPLDSSGNITRQLPANLVYFPQGMGFLAGIQNTVPAFELTSIYKGLSHHILRMNTGFRYETLSTHEARNYGPGVLEEPFPKTSINLKDISNTAYTFIGDHDRHVQSMAIQDEWQFADDWQLTTGLRYDHYSDFGNTWNPRAGLIWEIDPHLTAKLLYGQAFRAPSFLEQYQKNTPLFVGNSSVRPETISTTELAFDYRPSPNLRTALNVYHYEIQDLLSGEFVSNSTILTQQNTPGQDGYGSEFEWDWKFYPDWILRGNYAWQFARNEATHVRVSNVPEHHIYNSLCWNFAPQWQIQTQVNWIGHRLSSPGDTRLLEDYETVDLTLNARRLMGYLDVTASVRNLFDSKGKEPATISYPDNLPIATQTFYFETSVHF